MGKKVLIIDDEDEVRDFVSTLLEEHGYAPITASNGAEAMDMVRQDKPDLIIMDILMPKQGGIKMYRELKSEDSFKDIPVVVYSGIAKRTYLRTQAARTEMGDQSVPDPEAYIEKPAKPEKLAEVVRNLLN